MDKKNNLLALFSHNEHKVSRLYKLYGQKFQVSRDFWRTIADEETEHSDKLHRLDVELRDIGERFEKNEYSFAIVRYVSEFIDAELDRAKNKKLRPDEAIECALRLEQSMIENKSFEIFNPKIARVRQVVRKINDDTKDHVRRLKKQLRKIGTKK